ncbi:MAG: poly(A) polymerase, partial [Cognaticolwellia sp.]
RAIRFATKLDMQIHADTKAPIKSLAPLMANIPPARLFEEFLKLFMSGKAVENFQLLRYYSLFQYFFPAVDQQLNQQSQVYLADFIALAMKNTDYRVNNDQRVTPAFLFAAMLWYPMQEHIQRLNSETQLTPQDAFFGALSEVMSEQQRSISIPKRFQAVMKDIWILQEKLARRDGKRAFKALEHPKFRAGYDFLLLRAEIEGPTESTNEQGSSLQELAKWWGDFQECNVETQQVMVKSIVPGKSGPRRTTRKRRKPRVESSSNEA